MKDKEKQFKERIDCGIAYCEDTAVDEIKQDFKMQEEKNKQIEEMRKDLIEIIDEEYNIREEIIATFVFQKLYDLGYRKLPEDCVVLSREEYENIYKQAEQNVLANIADSGTSCHWCIEQHEEKERKKTAEKIIDLIKTFCPDKKFIEIISHIIAERFGVKIKE